MNHDYDLPQEVVDTLRGALGAQEEGAGSGLEEEDRLIEERGEEEAMTSIREVMTTDPRTLPATATIEEAARVMRDEDIGDVIVMEENDKLCGIVTDRDIVIRALANGETAAKLRGICSRELTTLSPDDKVGDAVKLMTEKAVRRLPIVDNGQPIGIVSLGDLAVTHDSDSGLAAISSAPANN